MAGLINTAVRVEGVLCWWEDGVELRFLNICSVAVDGFQGSVSVNREAIWTIADNGACETSLLQKRVEFRSTQTIFLVAPPEFQMSVALPGMIDRIPISDLGHERAWIFCERMNGKTVDCKEEKLVNVVSRC